MAEEFDDADFLAAAATVESSNTPQQGPSNSSNRTTTSTGVVQPKPQALPSRSGPSSILVSPRQKGNPILNHVKAIAWEYTDTPADYILGATTCALFLSLKYHRLHPEYIYSRIRALGKLYNLRVLLCMIDINNHEEALKELSKTSMINNLTLVLAWSAQEAGRYLELFKSYEHASPASIRARQAETYRDSLTEFVTTPRNINKTDAASLISNFGSLRAAVNAQPEELALIPGWGEKKVKSWSATVREPFRVKRSVKATSTLMRQDSAANSDSGASTPIPIGRVPALSREATRPGSSGGAQQGQKRQRLAELTPDDFNGPDVLDYDMNDDEEAMLLAAAEAENEKQNPLSAAQKAVPVQARKDPELSEGIAAALAKLREKS